MAAPKRTRREVERDRAEIERHYCRKMAQHEIADALNAAPPGTRTYVVSRDMVQDDLEALQKRWRGTRDLAEDRARELAAIDSLERTYWIAWEESRRDKVQVSDETVLPSAEQIALAECSPDYDKEKGLPLTLSKTVTKREGQAGNATYLAGVQWCISERCKLLGIYAPTKIAPTDPSGDNPYAAVSDEQLRRDIVKLVAAFTGASTDPTGTSPGGSALPVGVAGEAEPVRA